MINHVEQLLARLPVEEAGRVLIPYAANGWLIREYKRAGGEYLYVTAVEQDAQYTERLWRMPLFFRLQVDFLQVEPTPDFDLVIMATEDEELGFSQIVHGFHFLKPGGWLGALLSIQKMADHQFTSWVMAIGTVHHIVTVDGFYPYAVMITLRKPNEEEIEDVR